MLYAYFHQFVWKPYLILGYSCPIWLFWAKFGPTIDPILVHLTQISTGVSSNNIMYALVVVTILKNLQWAKVSGIYFQNWLFWTWFGPIWSKFGPNLGPIWAIWKFVSSAIISVVLWRWSSLSKILTETKSWDNQTVRKWNFIRAEICHFRCLYLSRRSVNMVFFCFPGLHFINT